VFQEVGEKFTKHKNAQNILPMIVEYILVPVSLSAGKWIMRCLLFQRPPLGKKLVRCDNQRQRNTNQNRNMNKKRQTHQEKDKQTDKCQEKMLQKQLFSPNQTNLYKL
jgi:hypothetical protein